MPGGQNVTGTLTVNAPMISSKWPAGPDELVRVWSSDPLVADTGSQFGAIAGGATSGTFTAFTRGLPDHAHGDVLRGAGRRRRQRAVDRARGADPFAELCDVPAFDGETAAKEASDASI